MSEVCQSCNYFTDGEYKCDITDPNACSACQKLAELQEKIKQIRTTLAGLEIERLKLKEEANRSHDKLTHHFPPEITSNIFQFCLPEDPMNLQFTHPALSTYTVCAPLILAGVCRWWRAVALSTPRLWNTMIIPCYPESYRRNRTVPRVPVPALVREWFNRAGQLPLSINFFDSGDGEWTPEELDIASQIIQELVTHASRWETLKYNGNPLFIYHLSRTLNGQVLPKLQTLDLTSYPSQLPDEIYQLELYPTMLKALSITEIRLSAIENLDWSHLTELSITDRPLSDCLEALRIAPGGLVRFVVRGLHRLQEWGSQVWHSQQVIVHSNIQYLDVEYEERSIHVPILKPMLESISCASLKTFILHSEGCNKVPMTVVVDFLQKSGCSLERFSLRGAMDKSNVTSLCRGMSTLQHLQIDFSDFPSVLELNAFLTLLAECLSVNGEIKFRCLPMLSSITLICYDHSDWIMLPEIITGNSEPISLKRRGLPLKSIWIFFRKYPREPRNERDRREQKIMKKMLQLVVLKSVKCRIEYG